MYLEPLKLLTAHIHVEPDMSINGEDLELHVDDPVLTLQEDGEVKVTVNIHLCSRRGYPEFMDVTLGTTVKNSDVGTFIGKNTHDDIKREATRFADEMFKAFAAWRNG